MVLQGTIQGPGVQNILITEKLKKKKKVNSNVEKFADNPEKKNC